MVYQWHGGYLKVGPLTLHGFFDGWAGLKGNTRQSFDFEWGVQQWLEWSYKILCVWSGFLRGKWHMGLRQFFLTSFSKYCSYCRSFHLWYETPSDNCSRMQVLQKLIFIESKSYTFAHFPPTSPFFLPLYIKAKFTLSSSCPQMVSGDPRGLLQQSISEFAPVQICFYSHHPAFICVVCIIA